MKTPGMISLIWMLGLCISYVQCSHFRGGTMSWRPTGVENQVEVTYKLSFHGFRMTDQIPPKGHDTCTQDAKEYGWELRTKGYTMCADSRSGRGCPGNTYRDMVWKCTDFDYKADWDIGGDVFNVTVPDANNKYTVSYAHCCWVEPLINSPVPEHSNQGWKMLTEIDLQPRADNGLINSSPSTEAIPLQQFHGGCKYHLEIPVSDPDGDPYRCRYTNGWKDECYEDSNGKYGDICYGLSYVTVHDNCTLEFDTSGGPGYYAVRVMIEDLDENDEPMSKVSLSFLLFVHPDSSTCDIPVIKQPLQSCKTLAAGQWYEEVVVVEAASEHKDLEITRIETSKPEGMLVSQLANVTENSIQKSVTLLWQPTREQIGQQKFGMNAVDKSGFASGWSFMTLDVKNIPPLKPLASESTPSPGATMNSTTDWVIKFTAERRRRKKKKGKKQNAGGAETQVVQGGGGGGGRGRSSENLQLIRPTTPAYIRLLDADGNTIDAVDSSNAYEVLFSGNELRFSMFAPPLPPGVHQFVLAIDPGVAIKEGSSADCGLYSIVMEWDVFLQGREPTTSAPEPTTTAEEPTTTPEPTTTQEPTTTPEPTTTEEPTTQPEPTTTEEPTTTPEPTTKEPPETDAPPAAAGPPGPPSAPQSNAAPAFRCTSETVVMSVAPPPNVVIGDLCFVHIVTPNAQVTQEGINMAYKICCPSDDCSGSRPPVQSDSETGFIIGGGAAEETVPEEEPEEPESKVIAAPDDVEETGAQG